MGGLCNAKQLALTPQVGRQKSHGVYMLVDAAKSGVLYARVGGLPGRWLHLTRCGLEKRRQVLNENENEGSKELLRLARLLESVNGPGGMRAAHSARD